MNKQMDVILFFFFKDFIYSFLEGKEGRNRGRETSMCERNRLVASCTPPAGDLAHNPGMCLAGNRTSDPSDHKLALNPLSHTSQGRWTSFFTWARDVLFS